MVAVLAVIAYVVAGLVGKLLGTLARLGVLVAAVALGYMLYIR